MEQLQSHNPSPVSEILPDSSVMSSALPADDGMQQLRHKMHEIRQLAASTEEMARNMHALMTRDYLDRKHDAIPQSQTSGTQQLDNPSPPRDIYNLTAEDLVPTFYPDVESQDEIDELLGEEESAPTLGCEHYKRNVKVQCSDCHMWFTCRHCHDASPNLPFPHALNRKKTENMLCMFCQMPQPAGETCRECGEDTAYYYCHKCKLWDNDSTKSIYHCDDCGICRRGEGLGKDYVHCKRCNVCISISTSDAHPCIERATDCDCPLCLDHLFSSTTPVVSLLCGHYMHALCYKNLMNVTYRCPVCNKSAVNMELQWRKLDDEIKMQPMPEEECEEAEGDSVTPTAHLPQDELIALAAQVQDMDMADPVPVRRRRLPKQVWVGCNDCGGRGWTNFHWLGLKCSVCDGYNTNQMNHIVGGDSRPSIPVTHLQRQHDFTGIDVLRGFSGGNASTSEPTETVEDRADSAYGTASSPQSQSTATQPRKVPVPTRRSYFLQAEPEDGPRPESSGSQDREGARFSPYEFLTRFGRSLSPMRYYLEGSEVRNAEVAAEGSDAANATKDIDDEGGVKAPHGNDDTLDFWGHDGSFLSAGEDDDEEEGSDSDEDDMSDDESVDSDADLGDGDGDAENDMMELFGHR